MADVFSPPSSKTLCTPSVTDTCTDSMTHVDVFTSMENTLTKLQTILANRRKKEGRPSEVRVSEKTFMFIHIYYTSSSL